MAMAIRLMYAGVLTGVELYVRPAELKVRGNRAWNTTVPPLYFRCSQRVEFTRLNEQAPIV
tara:strand:+ start:2725 stop:2907 length:183 start_codon:yes stop_codon:yes gene_type:complete